MVVAAAVVVEDDSLIDYSMSAFHLTALIR